MTSLRILVAGLPASLATWLARRLDAVVEVSFSGDDALEQLRHGDWGLLVLDAGADGLDEGNLSAQLRDRGKGAHLPMILTADPESGFGEEQIRELVHAARVDRILLHPLDRGELARHAAALLERELPQPQAEEPAAETAAPAPAPTQLGTALEAVWTRSRPQIMQRIATLQEAAHSLAEGALAAGLRRAAEADAHRLTGSLGTFGSPEGSNLARQIEQLLGGTSPLTTSDGRRLVRLAESLRTEVDARSARLAATAAVAPAPAPAVADDPALLLLVGMPAARAAGVEAEAATRGLRVRSVTSAELRAEGAGARPGAVVLELSAEDDGAELLAELGRRHPGAPLVVMAGRDSLLDRVRTLQLGARFFLPQSTQPAALLDAVIPALPRNGATTGPRVLAVDDDPQILDALSVLLGAEGMALQTLNDPLRFWSTLEAAHPELLILDVDMPHLNGIELCRVVRADPRWRRLPVVFLTARTDRDTLLRVFAAGADDYVTKPVVGPELLVRVRSRLERFRSL
ncbi:MAG TPA: response regulator [Longimicrobium sp.]|nr:response regulator [Longimicrobium sp.]